MFESRGRAKTAKVNVPTLHSLSRRIDEVTKNSNWYTGDVEQVEERISTLRSIARECGHVLGNPQMDDLDKASLTSTLSSLNTEIQLLSEVRDELDEGEGQEYVDDLPEYDVMNQFDDRRVDDTEDGYEEWQEHVAVETPSFVQSNLEAVHSSSEMRTRAVDHARSHLPGLLSHRTAARRVEAFVSAVEIERRKVARESQQRQPSTSLSTLRTASLQAPDSAIFF